MSGDTLEYLVEREIDVPPVPGKEGAALGKIYENNLNIGFTLEDQDRRGGAKIYGVTAIPCGRYELDLYDSPKHGLVPILRDVPNYEYVEIHGANDASQLLGCIAVGRNRLPRGVQDCAPVVQHIVASIRQAKSMGMKTFITIRRAGE